MDKSFIRTVKWHLSYNRQVILKSSKNLLPTLRLRRSYSGGIEALSAGEGEWREIGIKTLKEYDDFDVI